MHWSKIVLLSISQCGLSSAKTVEALCEISFHQTHQVSADTPNQGRVNCNSECNKLIDSTHKTFPVGNYCWAEKPTITVTGLRLMNGTAIFMKGACECTVSLVYESMPSQSCILRNAQKDLMKEWQERSPKVKDIPRDGLEYQPEPGC